MERYLPKFTFALEWFKGESESLQHTRNLLKEGMFSVDIEKVIKSNFGLFHYQEGKLFPVAVHIDTKKNVDRPYYDNKSFTEQEVREGHNNQENLGEWHKVHFVLCQRIEQEIRAKTYSRYRGSQSDSGTFNYAFTVNNKIILQSNNQKLNMCGYCKRKIQAEYNHIFNLLITKDTLKTVRLLQVKRIKKDLRASGQFNVYPDNWSKISRQVRDKYYWICRGEKCQYQDVNFRERENTKYLWVNHKNMDITDNTSVNLIPLCMVCHSQEPNHQHIKNHPLYKEFIAKFGYRPPSNQ